MDYCLPCFSKLRTKDGEREPLLPKHQPAEQPTTSAPNGTRSPEILGLGNNSIVDKVIDAFAALNVGKFPTQEQTTHFLQVLLRSELLKEDGSGDIAPGNGPASKEGRKVLKDVRSLLQALLQFGMEKNPDNKLQEIYFQLISLNESPVSVQVNVDVDNSMQKAQKAGEAALENTAHAANELKGEAPTKDELVFDASTLFSALRTIFETCLSSSIFRLLLSDILSILRDLVAHTAADVQRAAIEIQQVAADVGQKALNHDNGSDITAVDENGCPKKDLVSNTVNDVKEKGKEAAHKVKDVVKQEWNDLGGDATDKTREKILERIRQIISKIQQDPASRSAMRSILILARKYAEKISAASAAVSSSVEGTITDAKDAVVTNAGDESTPNYPPHPYHSACTSASASSKPDKRPFIDVASDAILEDIKEMLQRAANDHSLDALLNACGGIVHDLNKMPVVISKDVENSTSGSMTLTRSASSLISESGSQEISNPPQEQIHASKKRKNGKARRRQKAHDLKANVSGLAPPSPISASNSQDSTMSTRTRDEGTEKDEHEKQQTGENPLRVYFKRLGDYLDRAIEEKDWAISQEGEQTLEGLFMDGAELVNVVGESVVQVEEDLITGGGSSQSEMTEEDKKTAEKFGSKEDEIRRQFKKDLKYFLDEAEAYVSALESDRTTMKLIRAFEHMSIDLRALVSKGAQHGKKSPK